MTANKTMEDIIGSGGWAGKTLKSKDFAKTGEREREQGVVLTDVKWKIWKEKKQNFCSIIIWHHTTHFTSFLHVNSTNGNIGSMMSWFLQFNFHSTLHYKMLHMCINSMQTQCILTICSVVRSNSLGPKMAGAKNLRKMKPEITEYLTSLLSGKKKKKKITFSRAKFGSSKQN